MESVSAQLLTTSNEKIKKYEGSIGELQTGVFFVFSMDHGWIRSSKIVEAVTEGSVVTIQTRNSKYVFAIL